MKKDPRLEVPVTLRISQADLNALNLFAHKMRVKFEALIQEWIDLDIDRHIAMHPVKPETFTPARSTESDDDIAPAREEQY